MGMSEKLGKSSFILFVSIFFTHAILLGSISEDLNNAVEGMGATPRYLKTILYLLVYSFFPAGGYFALGSFFLKRRRYARYSASSVYLLAYFSWVLFVLIYNNYAGIVPKLEVLANPQEITSVAYHVLNQFVGIKEWCIFAMMLVCLYVSVPLIQKWNVPLVSGKIKKNFIFLLFFLNFKGIFQYTISNKWPWQFDKSEFMSKGHSMFSHRSDEAYRQGFVVCYLWHYFYKKRFLADVSEVEYPGPINKSVVFRNKRLEKKYNIVTIQVESLMEQVIGLRDRSGREITPFLNELRKNSLYFSNFYAQHGGGHSSDAELALFVSLLPMDTHPGISTAKKKYVRKNSLVSILKKNGYDTAVFHANFGHYFNRRKNYSKIGIDHFYESLDYHGKAVGFYTSQDADFFLQSIPKMKLLKKPFFAHFVTLQSHGPFKNYDKRTL